MALTKLNRVVFSDIKPHKFIERGDTLKGYYKGTTEVTIDNRPVKRTLFKTSAGLVSILGQADILTQLKDQSVSEGTWVEIIFTGQAKKLKGGRTMKLYDVAVDREDLDMEEVPTETPDQEEEELVESEDNDEVSYIAPTKPAVPAATATVSKQNHVKSLLSGKKTV